MRNSRFPVRVLATALLASTFLSVTAMAAPASTTAVQVNKGVGVVSSSAAVGTQSPVTVTSSEAQGSFQVTYQNENGVETSATVTSMGSPDNAIYGYVSAQGDGLRVRQGPGTSYPILATVMDGTSYAITGKTDGWYQITYQGRTAYVSSTYLVQSTPSSQPAANPSTPDANADIGTIQPPESFDGALAQRIVNFALQFKGYPYVYATAGPDSFDCSGLTYYVYKQFGYTLNRSSKDLVKNGVSVSKAELQPADLVLFSSNGSYVTHVGIYIGNGQFIHASTPTRGVVIDRLDTNYYVNCYFDARRIL